MVYDAVVIGSGFGGSVVACRLAERGMRVLVLERGRRWNVKTYPSVTNEDYVWDNDHADRKNGWFEFRMFKRIAVAAGAGVGGGSLVYANISVKPPVRTFERYWPEAITWAEMDPHLDTVGRMLGACKVPDNQEPPKLHLVRQAARTLGYGDRFQKLPLAVTFADSYERDPGVDPDYGAMALTPNAHGVPQGTCVHCGNCDLGCPTEARNTLAHNYLPLAERNRAEIRPMCLVKLIKPDGNGYRVFYRRVGSKSSKLEGVQCDKVFLACGSVGSTELLLRCRDQYRSLKDLPPSLGAKWSANGDFLTPATHAGEVNPTYGPTITCAVDFLNDPPDRAQFWVEDGGIPPVLANWIREHGRKGPWLWRRMLKGIHGALKDNIDHVMPWFAQGIDQSAGRLHLGRRWYWPCKNQLKMKWVPEHSSGVIDGIIDMHERMAAATDGKIQPPVAWRLLKWLITPHPLGGCNMADDISRGVTSHEGEVFGRKGLYVVDGAIVPFAIGLNPSRTIAALAERIAALVP